MARRTPPKKPRKMFIEGDLPSSPAWRSLSKKSAEILLLFYTKRQMAQISKRSPWTITNNGQITFSYKEAEDKGYRSATFRRCIDQLVEVGFIDIAGSGSGLFQVATKYAMSERWMKFGTANFIHKKRPPRPKHGQHIGFQKGHAPLGNRKKAATTDDS
jgi:hypothetical protein